MLLTHFLLIYLTNKTPYCFKNLNYNLTLNKKQIIFHNKTLLHVDGCHNSCWQSNCEKVRQKPSHQLKIKNLKEELLIYIKGNYIKKKFVYLSGWLSLFIYFFFLILNSNLYFPNFQYKMQITIFPIKI